ncbi:MAG: MBL fold metallo-hydrolase [Proteobacteria bacterium]|nr:MBL fold metallo-hydrolase [Pseudomonadota bacterium]
MEQYPIHVEIPQPKPGFNRFIASWVWLGDTNLLIDIGPAGSVDRLIDSLRAREVSRIDYVLLTHIHLDHAGGLAGILEAFPMAKAVCHAKAVKLMVDPAKLWAGSLQVLGDLAEMYGQPSPVPADRVMSHAQARIDGLRILETPGHAFHHLSFAWQGGLFAGEVAGVYYQTGDQVYMRPATPPRFFLEEALGSVDLVMALEDMPIFFGHYGQAASSREVLARTRGQLLLWRDVIADEMTRGAKDDLEARCVEAVLEKDPNIAAFRHMDPDTQARERYFLANSVRGYLGYLEEKA